MALFLAFASFLLIAGIVFFIWFIAAGGAKQDIVTERMEAVRQVERRGDLSPEVQLIRDEMLSDLPQLNRVLMQWNWVGGLRRFLNQAGLTIRPANLLLLSGALGLGTYLFLAYFYQQTTLAIIAGLAMACLPFGVIVWKRNKRLAKFEEHLPEALDLLGRAVRAGHSFTTGLELIGKECSQPVGGEFQTTFEEQKLGLPLRDSLLNLTERVPLVDVRLLVTALLIQRDTGGNLAEILDELSRVIRERFKIYRDVRVKTAQGRLTAAILIALPLIMIFLLSLVNPAYVKLLFTDPSGPTLLGVAATLQVVGSLVLWKIVNIDV